MMAEVKLMQAKKFLGVEPDCASHVVVASSVDAANKWVEADVTIGFGDGKSTHIGLYEEVGSEGIDAYVASLGKLIDVLTKLRKSVAPFTGAGLAQARAATQEDE